jgi:hypothetical protein
VSREPGSGSFDQIPLRPSGAVSRDVASVYVIIAKVVGADAASGPLLARRSSRTGRS